MSEMVERIAIVLWERARTADAKIGEPQRPPWSGASSGSKAIALDAARLVLEAMREPTAEMLAVASRCDSSDLIHDAAPETYWTAMIDEALR